MNDIKPKRILIQFSFKKYYICNLLSALEDLININFYSSLILYIKILKTYLINRMSAVFKMLIEIIMTEDVKFQFPA